MSILRSNVEKGVQDIEFYRSQIKCSGPFSKKKTHQDFVEKFSKALKINTTLSQTAFEIKMEASRKKLFTASVLSPDIFDDTIDPAFKDVLFLKHLFGPKPHF